MTLLRLKAPAAVLLFLGFLFVLTSCETTEPKKSAALPAHAATAPEVTEPVVQKAVPPPKVQ